MTPTTSPGQRRARRRLVSGVAAIATLGLLTAACGDGDDLSAPSTTEDDAPSTTDAPATSDAPATTASGSPSTDPDPTPTTDGTKAGGAGAISDVADAQSGTIQIVAQGSFRDPEEGLLVGAGRGSGFFIDESGIAVTNQHVVTGAATLEVFVGGDTTTSYNAQVLGVSECSDLAVIQVDTSDPVPHFEWYQDEIRAGLDVYAAGFPLGDPEFTMTRGIVGKANASGDVTGTSSIDHTIEHDAVTHPGNSGGPLIDAEGRVVGINYAGGQSGAASTSQYYSIAADLAADIVAELEQGNTESLGINGQAVANEDGSIVGIWVAGVEPGSPASDAGLLSGDIVTSLNGLPMGTDGTFKDYCDVIRTAGDRPINAEVLRLDTEEVLVGEINGDQPLEVKVSLAQQVEQNAGGDVPVEGSTYTEYVAITDDTGGLTMEVPAQWSQVDGLPLQLGDDQAPQLSAAPDLGSFRQTFDTPGVQFAAVPATVVDLDGALAQFAQPDGCTDGGVFDYDDGAFVGRYQLWESCGGGSTMLVVLATNIAGNPDITFVTNVQAVTEADLEALDHILATFNVTG